MSLSKKILLAALASAAMTTGYAFAQGGGGKNLKVLPKTMSKPELKKTMKEMSKALGVQCDHCHDPDDMSLDNEKKEVARQMMTMSMDINKKFFKGQRKVTCMTCHNGKADPGK